MSASSYGGADRHADLAGLGNDDHPQYGMNLSGLAAARPAFGRAGRLYVATDTGITSIDTGSAWVDAGAPAAAYAAQVFPSGPVATVSGAYTAIGMDSESYDTFGLHDPTTNNSRITVQRPGKYLVTASARWSPHAIAGAYRAITIRKNGVVAPLLAHWATVPPANNLYLPHHQIAGGLVLAAGDYVELYAYQDSGAAASVTGGVDACNFGVSLMGA